MRQRVSLECDCSECQQQRQRSDATKNRCVWCQVFERFRFMKRNISFLVCACSWRKVHNSKTLMCHHVSRIGASHFRDVCAWSTQLQTVTCKCIVHRAPSSQESNERAAWHDRASTSTARPCVFFMTCDLGRVHDTSQCVLVFPTTPLYWFH